jgi:hypothetical protein
VFYDISAAIYSLCEGVSFFAFYLFQSFLVQVISIFHATRKMAVSISGMEGWEGRV